MMDGLFSAGFAWGDDDSVADFATPVATTVATAAQTEKVGFPNVFDPAVAGVAGVATMTGKHLAERLSQPPVSGPATLAATAGTAVSCGVQGAALPGVASVATVAAWKDGIASMTRMIGASPPYYGRSWRQLIRDARRFLADWGDDAVRLGWSTLDVFGSNPVPSHRRLDRVGLVALLEGDQVHSMDAGSAMIGRGRDILTYRRSPRAAGSVPIWMMDISQ